ncbi:MAG: response regulator [Desulforegulaceae bacterium]|nr:response regulator [Desulforegulaceae bacterium]
MKNILVVDHDITFMKMIAKKFESGTKQFNPIFVKDGALAVNQLKKTKIDIIISALQMPKMDGYSLLEFLNLNYPDIPLIIITAFGKPKSREILMEKGASAYFVKPVNFDELISKIKDLKEEKSNGGILRSASLEMFAQLVEMEQKTCTIRIKRESDGKEGVLCFKEGEIYFARIGNLKGLEAAYKIFSWQNVTLYIENNCRIKKKKINSELQALLLEAMRLKDEKEVKKSSAKNKDSREPQKLSPVDSLKKYIEDNLPDKTGVLDVYQDSSWSEFIKSSSMLGLVFKKEDLKACYVSKVDSTNFIIVPDKENTVLSVSSKCDREKIYKILMD